MCIRIGWLTGEGLAGYAGVPSRALRGENQLSLLREAQVILAPVVLDDQRPGGAQQRLARRPGGRPWAIVPFGTRYDRLCIILHSANDNYSHSYAQGVYSKRLRL